MLICFICGFESENLTSHINKIHCITAKEYKKTFNVKYVQSDRLRAIHKQTIDAKNPTKGIGHTPTVITKMSNNRKNKGIGVAGKYIRTKEIREKISNGVTEAHIRGDFDNVKPGVGSFIFSKKNNKTIFARSTWERELIEIFDLHPKINYIDNEPFAIPYMFDGSQHNYIPDFLVRYDDAIDSMWEVKRDDFIFDDPKTVAKLEALSEFCHNKGMNMFVVDSKILKLLRTYIKSIKND